VNEEGKLKQYLQGTFAELNKLAEQIRATQDYSEHAELILCLRELVEEQMGTKNCENSSHSTYAIG
jgi:hypothetical protein